MADEFPEYEPITSGLEAVTWETRVSLTDRYYTIFYIADIKNQPGVDQVILVHTNGLCLVGLSPHSPILSNVKRTHEPTLESHHKNACSIIKSIQYTAKNHGVSRLAMVGQGKKKNSAYTIYKDTYLCHFSIKNNVEPPSSVEYELKCCVDGKFVEINQELLEKPHLLLEPFDGGYIAIIMPKKDNPFFTQSPEFMTSEKYFQLRDVQK